METPNYGHCRQMFHDMPLRKGNVYDYRDDWMLANPIAKTSVARKSRFRFCGGRRSLSMVLMSTIWASHLLNVRVHGLPFEVLISSEWIVISQCTN
jgi:hypothetical protein